MRAGRTCTGSQSSPVCPLLMQAQTANTGQRPRVRVPSSPPFFSSAQQELAIWVMVQSVQCFSLLNNIRTSLLCASRLFGTARM